jgi:flavin-dependent dehydrogenase
MVNPDVFIIGGGPVGLAAAIAARRKGFSVVLADGCAPPVDKACGEGVMPDGLTAAAQLGLQLPLKDSFALRGIRFHGENVSVAADFPTGSPDKYGRGFRRTILHQSLAEHAERCGVELRWGTTIRDLTGIQARWIVGADGTGSRIRALAGLDACRRDTRRYGFRRHFQIAPWADYVEIHWGEGCQIYVTPVAPEEVGVAVISSDPKLRVHDALRQFPVLAARVAGVRESSGERGGVTATRQLRRVVGGNVALIGDASGSVDAITGEGLCLGFHQALALADAMECGDLARYESAHRRLAVRPRFMADFMLTMDRRRGLRKRALPALASHPELFEGLLAMHVGASRPADFAVNCLALGWRMLTS